MTSIEGRCSKSDGQVTKMAPESELGGNQYKLKIFQTNLTLLANVLIGIVVGAVLVFAFRNGIPLGATPLHATLCVVGYQLLMSQAILAMSPDNGWSSFLKLVDKKRAHLTLQIMGSGLAIAGSFIKILDKEVHWNTLHGRFALVALVFTSVCLVNGLASLYAYEARKFLPGNISKLTHVCFGIVAYSAAGITLCIGFNKGTFVNWASQAVANTVIAFTTTFSLIVIINPCITFFNKSMRVIKLSRT